MGKNRLPYSEESEKHAPPTVAAKSSWNSRPTRCVMCLPAELDYDECVPIRKPTYFDQKPPDPQWNIESMMPREPSFERQEIFYLLFLEPTPEARHTPQATTILLGFTLSRQGNLHHHEPTHGQSATPQHPATTPDTQRFSILNTFVPHTGQTP